MEETESDENDEVWLSDEVEAAEPACSSGRLELCEVAEEEEEIAGWELSDDVIEEEDDSAEEDRLDELPSFPTLVTEEDAATLEELELEDELPDERLEEETDVD